MIDTYIDGMVDKIDNNLLREQIDFFSEIRHAYHEYNMVEEAIYDVSQNEELEVSKQAEKIYEVLISDDPETELEKYYDIAPNSFLKEFAGISYLTKEFGDRKVDGASLYLKNVNNITQEMQIEILKRAKEGLEKGIPLRLIEFNEEEIKLLKTFSLITLKPMIYLANVKESEVSSTNEYVDIVKEYAKKERAQTIKICAKLESELSELNDDDYKKFYEELYAEGLSVAKKGNISTWFDSKEKTFGGEQAVSLISNMVGNAARFNLEGLPDVPKCDLKDLQNFFKRAITLQGKKLIVKMHT